MSYRILALLLCMSLGAGAVPVLAAESEKTSSPAVTVEAGKSSGTEPAASSAASAAEGTESSVSATGETEPAASSAASAAEGAESSVPATGETEPPAAESDEGDLIYIDVDDVAEAIKEIDETAAQLLEKLEHVDKQQLMKNLIALQALLQSEEFRTIINYQEIKDLIQEMLASVIDFAKSDEELCIEILDKLGIPRVLGTVIMEGLAVSSLTGDVVRNLSIDEFYKQLELFNSVINKVIEENDVLKAVSSLELDGGA